MSLREEDPKGVVLPKISVDEFEPKTGEKEDISSNWLVCKRRVLLERIQQTLLTKVACP